MNKNFIPLLISAMALPSLTSAEGLLMYKPPQTGSPIVSIGGGTRSLTPIQLLAPKHTALTSQSQPVLYWYLLLANQQTIEITLAKEGVNQPLFKKQLPAIAKAGLQSIRLADYDVHLQVDQEYQWSVAFINEERHAEDVIASTTLRYQLPAAPLSSAEQQAEAGYWYDALQQLIEGNSPLANDLLKQVGLRIPPL